VEGDPHCGLINDTNTYPKLSEELIVSLNEKEGKKNISTGYHAIEFLLWGQDLSATDCGNRPWTDFSKERNAERRSQCLRIIAQDLAKQLRFLAHEWEAGRADNYRARFLACSPDEALGRVIRGLGALSGPELAGERLTTPYETKEQEEEQDCFSDNTLNDLRNDALGIENIFLGKYTGLQSEPAAPGLYDVIRSTNPELAERLKSQIATSIQALELVPNPFDQAIAGKDSAPSRSAIKAAIKSLQAQSDLFAQAGAVFPAPGGLSAASGLNP
jgi:putative iron-regulated protein